MTESGREVEVGLDARRTTVALVLVLSQVVLPSVGPIAIRHRTRIMSSSCWKRVRRDVSL